LLLQARALRSDISDFLVLGKLTGLTLLLSRKKSLISGRFLFGRSSAFL
jgi:hypothetical protein